MIPRLVTPPALEPVSVDEAKAHLRVIADDEDAYIASLIAAARQMVESGESWSLERSLVTTAWRLTLDAFAPAIELPRPPLIAVTSVAYVDTAGTTRTLDPSRYAVDAQGEPGRLTPAYGLPWPATRCQPNAVTIAYTAGFGPAAADVPQSVRQAILLLVGDLFEQRQATITGTIVNVLPACRALLNTQKWCYR